MKSTTEINKTSQKDILTIVLQKHLELKNTIDRMFNNAWDLNAIEPLTEIRSMNTACISKYNDLIANDEVLLENELSELITSLEGKAKLNLFEINTQLSKFIPVYQKAMSNTNLSSFVRMLLSFNLEKLVMVRENLLHPIPENMTA